MNEREVEIPPMKVHRKQIYQRFPAQYDILARSHDYEVSFKD